ncbi:hypothetical protein AX16_004444 [Volvariella volvacea WC 439]|nr:hypothetical protein AX16_004444 [Volvariella volvacea WC 439]
MSIQVPPEIIASIIDHLADDRSTLKACSLVARPFVYPSHKHFFRHVDITLFPKSSLEINERLSKICAGSEYNLSRVRSLSMKSLNWTQHQSGYNRRLLIRALQSLVNLNEVSVICLQHWQPFLTGDETGITNADILRECCRPSITKLSLSGSYYYPANHFELCTSLTHLSLEHCAFLPPSQGAISATQILLKSLHLGPFWEPVATGSLQGPGMPATEFLQQPFSPWSIEHLEEFSFRAANDMQYDEFTNFMRCLPVSITSFTAELPYAFQTRSTAQEITTLIDISAFPRLSHFGLKVQEHEPERNGCVPWATAQLRSVPISNSLSKLHLEFTFDRRCNFIPDGGCEWDELDDCLADSRFDKVDVLSLIQSLTINFTDPRSSFDRGLLIRVLKLFVNITEVAIGSRHDEEPLFIENETRITIADILTELCRPKITSLRLDDNHYLPTDEFYNCTSLTHLSLGNCALLLPRPERTSSKRIPLKSLHLGPFWWPSTPGHGTLAALFLPQSFSPWNISTLEEFSFLAKLQMHYEEFVSFMRYLPTSITSLTAEMPYTFEIDSEAEDAATRPPPSIDISMLPNLTFFGLIVREDMSGQNGYIPWITTQLRKIPADNVLSELFLAFKLFEEGEFEPDDGPEWNALDDCLVDGRFDQVRTVHIEVQAGILARSNEWTEQVVKRLLSNTMECKPLFVTKSTLPIE